MPGHETVLGAWSKEEVVMRYRSMLGTGLLLVLANLPAAGESSGTVTLALPAGDPVAGRAAFIALSCTSCHRVQGEEGLPEPVSANPGPTFGAHDARQTPAQLADSIIAPSHVISATLREPQEGKLSPMGDFSQAMTVRQFLDIIAYLQSLEAPKAR
jgi:hypothetical protein